MNTPLVKKLAVVVATAVSVSSLGMLAATAHEVPGCKNPVPKITNKHCLPGHGDDDNGGGGERACDNLLDSIVSAVLTGDVDVDIDDPLTVDAGALLCLDVELPVGRIDAAGDHLLQKVREVEVKELAEAAAAKVLYLVGKVEHKVDWLLEYGQDADMEEEIGATLIVIAQVRAEIDLMLNNLRSDVRQAVGRTFLIAFDALGDAKDNAESALSLVRKVKHDVAGTAGSTVLNVGRTLFSLRDNLGSAAASVSASVQVIAEAVPATP